jgi:hypothetical protein
VHRYRTDKEFSKKVLAKYGQVTDEEILEGTWQEYAPTSASRVNLFAGHRAENPHCGLKPR